MKSPRIALLLLLLGVARISALAEENVLSEQERQEGWQLLFDGKTTKGWMSPKEKPLDQSHVQNGSLNPHPCDYMLVHEKVWENYQLALDFKISPKCNSGVFVRTFPLTPRPGKDVGFNGIEVAIDDTSSAGFHDTGAIYDLVKPKKSKSMAKRSIGLTLTNGPNRISGPTGRHTSLMLPINCIPVKAISACRTMGVIAGTGTSRLCHAPDFIESRCDFWHRKVRF